MNFKNHYKTKAKSTSKLSAVYSCTFCEAREIAFDLIKLAAFLFNKISLIFITPTKL